MTGTVAETTEDMSEELCRKDTVTSRIMGSTRWSFSGRREKERKSERERAVSPVK